MIRRLLMVWGSMCLCAASASAQSKFDRGWIDVNFGVAVAAEKTRATTETVTIAREPATFETTYSFPTGAAFDFGGGVMLTPFSGIGVSVSGTAHEDVASLRIRIPHPNFFNAFATDDNETESKLQRTEGTIHIQGMFVLPTGSDRVRVRAFGGPSYFRLKMDAVTDIRYNQFFQIFNTGNVVEITTFDSEEVEETGWGFHVGGDVSVFFTRVVGVGGFARFSRGTVTIDDDAILSNEPVDFKTGGFQAGGGLRLKF